MRDWALGYGIDLGWRVLPLHTVVGGRCDCYLAALCEHPGKHPRNENGVTGASSDPAVIERWWSTWPDAGIGVAAGEHFDAFDIEADHLDALDTIWQYPGLTPIAVTGRGGIRVLTRPTGVNRNTKLYIGDVHVGELKSRGGYIVVSPTVTVGQYRWMRAPQGMIAVEAPGWLRALVPPRPAFAAAPVRRARSLAEARRGLEVLAATVAAQAKGSRNDILYWASCRALEEGSPPSAVAHAMTAAGKAAGLGEDEIRASVRSAIGRVGASA